MDLICHFKLTFARIEETHGVDFCRTFGRELEALEPFIREGFVERTDNGLTVTETGRFVIRNICMVFDAYLGKMEQGGQRFSKTV